MQSDERAGEINDDVALMREWSQFPVKVIDRSNIEPRINGALRPVHKTLREHYADWVKSNEDEHFDA